MRVKILDEYEILAINLYITHKDWSYEKITEVVYGEDDIAYKLFPIEEKTSNYSKYKDWLREKHFSDYKIYVQTSLSYEYWSGLSDHLLTWYARNNIEIYKMKRVYGEKSYLYLKWKKNYYLNKVKEIIGFYLMRLCRSEKDICPFKDLLPEYEVKDNE